MSGTEIETYELKDMKVKGTERVELKKTIGLLGGSGIIIGVIIGSGIFISPALTLKNSGSIGIALIVWVVCGIVSILGGLCFAELGVTIVKSGAEYNYIMDSFGDIWAFLFLWSSVVTIKPASVTIMAIVCAKYAVEPFFPNCEIPGIIIKLLATAIILTTSLINMLNVKWSIRLNNILNWSKFICIGIICGVGIYAATQGGYKHFENMFEGSILDAGRFGQALYMGFWAYDGWNYVNYAAEEMENPEKNLPLSIIIGMTVVIISYVVINICYVFALGKNGILHSDATALTVGQRYLGPAAFLMPVLVSAAVFGATNSSIFGNGRLLFVAGREGHLPNLISCIHNTLHTPIPSISLTSFFSLLYLIPSIDDLDLLINIFSFEIWFFFGLCFVALVYLRFKRPELNRPFKIWIGIPIIMTVVSIVLIVLPAIDDWLSFVIATAIVVAGIPVYFIFIKGRKHFPKCFIDATAKFDNFMMKVFNLSMAEREEDLS